MNEIDLVSEELKRPKSRRRRKKIIKLVTPDFIRNIESEIIKIEYYLTGKIIKNRNTDYRPCIGDEDQHLRDRVSYLRSIIIIKLG